MPPSAKGRAGDGWFGGGGGRVGDLGLSPPPWIAAAFSCHSVHGNGGGGGARRGLEGGGAGYRGKPGPRPCPLLPAYDGEKPALRPGVWASASHACNTGVNRGAQRGETTLSPLEDYRLMPAEFVHISIVYRTVATACTATACTATACTATACTATACTATACTATACTDCAHARARSHSPFLARARPAPRRPPLACLPDSPPRSGRGAAALADAGLGWGGGGRKVPVAAVGLSAGNGDVEVTGSERSEAARKLSWSQVAEEGRGAEGRVFEVGRSETRKIATSSSPSSGFGVAERTGLYGGFQEVDVWERGGGGGRDVVALVVDPQQLFARPMGERVIGDGEGGGGGCCFRGKETDQECSLAALEVDTMTQDDIERLLLVCMCMCV
jgi:hypothetical protein